MTRTKAKTPKTKAPKQGEARTFKVKYVVNLDPVVMLAPPTELEKCPRCEKPHKKLKPKKLTRPMLFSNCSVTYWVLCPATKEPIIFFDRFTKVLFENDIEKAVADRAAKDIAAEIDKDVLSSLSTWTATYTTAEKKKGKKGKAEPMQITASFGPATTWVYDPNAPERIVPGSKEEHDKQVASVRAQEAMASVSLAAGPKTEKTKRAK